MGGRGGGGGGPPGQAPAAGGGPRVVGVATRVAGEEMGGDAPPLEMGVKMYELAELNLFTPERKRGGGHWRFIANCWQGLGLGGMEYGASTWTWTPILSALMDMGGFDPEAANRGAYAGLVHGIASRLKSTPKPAATPAAGQARCVRQVGVYAQELHNTAHSSRHGTQCTIVGIWHNPGIGHTVGRAGKCGRRDCTRGDAYGRAPRQASGTCTVGLEHNTQTLAARSTRCRTSNGARRAVPGSTTGTLTRPPCAKRWTQRAAVLGTQCTTQHSTESSAPQCGAQCRASDWHTAF